MVMNIMKFIYSIFIIFLIFASCKQKDEASANSRKSIINNEEHNEKVENFVIGGFIENIVLKDSAGIVQPLEKYTGKYTLVDFWASWCKPCRSQNKKLIPVYEKYKSQGFEIYAVSVDNYEKKWKKSLQHDKTPWVNTIARNGFNNKYLKNFKIHSIPSNFLIDANKKIIAVNISPIKLEKKLDIVLNNTKE